MNEIRYPYQDESGSTLYTKVRLHAPDDSKTFYCERLDECGNTIKNLQGCRKVLYRLPQLISGIIEPSRIFIRPQVFLVEGEKDVETLIAHRLIATTTAGSLEWDDAFTAQLANADVVILYDMDKTGIQRKKLLCHKLYGYVRRLRVVDLPGLEYRDKHGEDITDWLEQGHTIQELLALIDQTNDYIPPVQEQLAPMQGIRSVGIEDFLALQLPKREVILSPFLTKQGLVMLYAKRGVGKTHVALGIAYAVSSGGSFLKWQASKPRKVTYIDGEMPATTLQERLHKITVGANVTATNENLKIITPDLQYDILPDLATKGGQQAIEVLIEDSELIILDNISSLFRSGAENEAEGWQPIQEWALHLRRKGKAVLFIHHAGKSGQQRGTSKREDLLDAIIILKQPEGYQAEEGACFEIHFEKNRHFYGEDAAAFKVTLTDEGIDNNLNWEVSHVDVDEQVTEIADLMNEGLTIVEMEQKTKLTKSQVETLRKKARKLGLTQK